MATKNSLYSFQDLPGVDNFEFDDEFANEETPGTLGGNVDGSTNLNLTNDELTELVESYDAEQDVTGIDTYDDPEPLEEPPFEVDYPEFGASQTMQEYQGWSDDDVFDEVVYTQMNQGGPGSGRKPMGKIKKVIKKVKRALGR